MLSEAKRRVVSAAHRAGMLGPFRRRLPEPIWRHLAFRGVFDEDLGQGRSFRMHHGGAQVENSIYWAGWGRAFEGWSGRLWVRLAERARWIVDVGANTGAYALTAQAVAPTDARIMAIEPVERVFKRLAKNVALNGDKIELAKLALSDHDGEAALYDVDSEHVYSTSLEQRMLGDRATGVSPVPVMRLDDLLASRGWPGADLLKIDVELHEPAVFRGMPRVLESRPPILVEILLPDVGEALLRLTEGLGYELFEIDEARGPLPCTRPGWRGGPPGYQNHLFLHPSTPLSREGWPSA